MMPTLRPYQAELEARITADCAPNRLVVLPTGAGKTMLFAHRMRTARGACCAIAHRQELVSQISTALARFEVPHRIVGPRSVVKLCVNLHMEKVGRSFYHPTAACAVAGVDTLIRRKKALEGWLPSVTEWVMDEAHHIIQGNKWGEAVAMFPRARGTGYTATPCRADGKGLGRHADGVFDTIHVGPGMRDIINMGYLTDYRIFAPLSHIELRDVHTGATGDYVPAQLKRAVRRSPIVGDVVESYIRIASGKLGVTFATDVETAGDIARQFAAAGVPSAMVHAGTPDAERISTIRRFERREIMQLVNVDLFGEGFDLPAIECVSFARPTMSYGLYVQQFGRGLRPMSGKTHAIIIDHVGNTLKSWGLPDAAREWTLDRREKRNDDTDRTPLKVCPRCTRVFERFRRDCPYCGHYEPPRDRSKPEFVDGDLTELDAATLARLRGEVDAVDRSAEDYRAELARKYVPLIAQLANVKRHIARQDAQRVLRDSIAWWAGYQRVQGRDDSESYRLFWLTFGVDVLTAQSLGVNDALAMAEKVRSECKL